MGVGYVVVLHIGVIAADRVFGNGIGDLFAVFVLGKTLKGPGPAIGGGNGLGSHRYTVGQKVDGDAIGTDSILVIVVHPGLLAGNLHRFRDMGVGYVVAIHNGSIICDSFFRDGIVDYIAVFVLGEIAKVPGPAIGGGNGLGSHRFTVGQQVDGDALGAFAVLVTIVRPGLLAGNLHRFGGMGVGYVVVLHVGVIAADRIFRNGIVDCDSVLVLGEIFKGPGPAIGGGNGLGSHRLTVGQQVDGDAIGTDSILVIVVHPGLPAGNLNRFRDVGVGDHAALYGLGIPGGHGGLIDGVHSGISAKAHPLGKTIPGIFPTFFFVQGYGVTVGRAVLFQLNRYEIGTEVILVVVILPLLGDGKAGGSDPPLGGEGHRCPGHREGGVAGDVLGDIVVALDPAGKFIVKVCGLTESGVGGRLDRYDGADLVLAALGHGAGQSAVQNAPVVGNGVFGVILLQLDQQPVGIFLAAVTHLSLRNGNVAVSLTCAGHHTIDGDYVSAGICPAAVFIAADDLPAVQVPAGVEADPNTVRIGCAGGGRGAAPGQISTVFHHDILDTGEITTRCKAVISKGIA